MQFCYIAAYNIYLHVRAMSLRSSVDNDNLVFEIFPIFQIIRNTLSVKTCKSSKIRLIYQPKVIIWYIYIYLFIFYKWTLYCFKSSLNILKSCHNSTDDVFIMVLFEMNYIQKFVKMEIV